MTHAMEHCQRPWWKRPPVWFVAIAVVLGLLIGIGAEIESTGKSTVMTYGAFLNQLEAGNVANVTFQGTEIRGRFKQALKDTQQDAFSTRVPDFGDPALIPELRKQQVAIDVGTPSPWTSVLARIPWPMLVFLAVVLVAALVRLVRGGKAQAGSAGPTMPMHGIMGLVSKLFAKQHPGESPPTRDSDEPKNR